MTTTTICVPKRFSCVPSQSIKVVSIPTVHSQATGNHWCTSCHHGLDLSLLVFHKNGLVHHVLSFLFFGLASFNQPNYFEIYPCFVLLIVHYFSLLIISLLYGCTTIYLFIKYLTLIDIWVVSRFWLFWINFVYVQILYIFHFPCINTQKLSWWVIW